MRGKCPRFIVTKIEPALSDHLRRGWLRFLRLFPHSHHLIHPSNTSLCHSFWLIYHQNLITRHQSFITRHQSFITRHQSFITRHQTFITRHQSFITRHQSFITRHQTFITRHQSFITRHQYLITHEEDLITNNLFLFARQRIGFDGAPVRLFTAFENVARQSLRPFYPPPRRTRGQCLIDLLFFPFLCRTESNPTYG